MDVRDLPTKSEEEIRKLYHKLDLALEASRIGIWEHDIATDKVTWDRRLCEIYGVPRTDDLVWLDRVHPADRDRASADFTNAVNKKGSYASQFRIVRPDGAILHLRSSAAYFEDKAGRSLMIGAEWDVTADVLMQEELARRAEQLEESYRLIEHTALHDHLTGLPNRRGLEQWVAAREGRTPASYIAVLHIDLDNFKTVNDRLGHRAGDRLLEGFALRVRALLPPGGFAARTGGDEFIVVLENATARTARLLAEAVLATAFITQTDPSGAEIRAGASIGIALGDAAFDQLLTQADLALYKAKEGGRNRYSIFGERMPRKRAA